MEPAAYLEDSQPRYMGNEEITSQFDELGYSFREFGFEHSPPTRGVEVWAVLKEIGVEGVRERICRHNSYAQHLAEGIEASPTLELVAPYSLSTCCYRYVPEELAGDTSEKALAALNNLNQIVLGRVRARSLAMPSATFADGAFALRSCFINPRTQLEHIDTLLAELEICGKEVWQEMKNQGKV
jgi:aromatic-L-amino-acid decarboxylase